MARFLSFWGKSSNPPPGLESAPDLSDTNAGPKRFTAGLKLLASGGLKPVVDVVFVHGLTGDREKTWKTPSSATSWPEGLLPAAIPNARILTFGYDAHVSDWRSMVSINRVGNHAMNLISALATWRDEDDTNERPIFFVCHSLGGIVCQDAISTSQQYPEPHIHGLAECIRGIVFFGTPHGGSGLARWAEMLARSISLIKQTNSELLSVLERESEVLARIQNSFHAFVRSKLVNGQVINMTTFYEELPLPGIGPVVPLQSAIIPGYPSIGIHATHMGMTKFETSDDAGFIAVVGELRRWTRQIEKDSERERAGHDQLGDVTQNRSSQSEKKQQDDIQSSSSQSALPPKLHGKPWAKNTIFVFRGIAGWNSHKINHRIRELLERLYRVDKEHDIQAVLYLGVLAEHPEYVKFGCSTSVSRRVSELQRRYQLTLTQIYTFSTNRSILTLVERLTELNLKCQYYCLDEPTGPVLGVYKVNLDKARHVIDR